MNVHCVGRRVPVLKYGTAGLFHTGRRVMHVLMVLPVRFLPLIVKSVIMQPVGDGSDHDHQEEERQHDLQYHQPHHYRVFGGDIAISNGSRGNETEVYGLEVGQV